MVLLHLWDAGYLLLSPHVLFSFFFPSGHVSASRGVWDDHSDRRHHRKPVVSGEQRSSEPLQGSGSGASVGGGGGLDSAPCGGLSGSAGSGFRCGGTGLFRDLLGVSVCPALVIIARHLSRLQRPRPSRFDDLVARRVSGLVSRANICLPPRL